MNILLTSGPTLIAETYPLFIDEVEVRGAGPTHQNNGVFSSDRHIPRMIKFARDHYITAHTQIVAFISQHDS